MFRENASRRWRASFSESQPKGEFLGQPCGNDFLLGCLDVVGNAAKLQIQRFRLINDIGSPPVAVAWLSDAPRIDEIACSGGQPEFFIGLTAYGNAGLKQHGIVGVSVEADGRVLVGEARGGVACGSDVAPFVRCIEGGVDNGKVPNDALQPQGAQPFLVIVTKLCAGPANCGGGQAAEIRAGARHCRLFVVVPFYDGAVQSANNFDALHWIGVVAHDVTEADVVCAVLNFCIGQHGLQCFQVAVNVTEYGNAHGL